LGFSRHNPGHTKKRTQGVQWEGRVFAQVTVSKGVVLAAVDAVQVLVSPAPFTGRHADERGVVSQWRANEESEKRKPRRLTRDIGIVDLWTNKTLRRVHRLLIRISICPRGKVT
jgi:hypothetical protein